jgi:hypothetical protein
MGALALSRRKTIELAKVEASFHLGVLRATRSKRPEVIEIDRIK